MADDSAYAEAMGKVLRDPADPAERAPQRIFHDGVLIQNWVEDRTSSIRRMSATAPRTVQHYPALPTGYESSAAAANTKMVTAQRTYVAPPWRQHTEPYSNISLMDNWFEDRFSHDLVRQTGLRTMSPAVHGREEQADMLRTTKQVEGHAFTTAARVQPRLQPRLFTLRSATATVHADRTTGAPERGFGATLPRHDEAEGQPQQRLYNTTNKDFWREAEAAEAADPAHFVLQSRHHVKPTLRHDTYEEGKRHIDPPGRGGARGEISRNPREAGGKYGPCVFADEYAQSFPRATGVVAATGK